MGEIQGPSVNASDRAWFRQVSSDGWRALSAAGLGWLCEVYDIFILSLTIPAFLVDLHMSKAEAGFVGSASAAGLIVGGVVNGWIADRIGRTRSLAISIAVYTVFCLLTAFATSGTQIAALRFFTGLGMGGEWTAGAALVAETWPPKHRGKGGALMQTGLALGSLVAIGVAGLVTVVTGSLTHGGWRWLYVIGGTFPILVAFYAWFLVPESPLWKAGRIKRQMGTLRGLFAGSTLAPLIKAFAFVFFNQYIYWAVFTFAPTFLVSVKHLTIVNSLSFVLSQQIGSLVGFIVFAVLVDWWGRKPSFILYVIVGAIAMILYTYLVEPGALIVVTFFTGFGITGIFAGLGPWSAEMMANNSSRGLAMGVIYNGGRVGGLIAPALVGILAASAGGFQAAMLTTVVAFVLALIAMGVSRETKGVVLE